MPTIEELFSILQNRGCMAKPRDPRREEDPRKKAKLKYMAACLWEEQDANGRVHPHYRRLANGGVVTRNPNIFLMNTFTCNPLDEVIWVSPQALEAAWWVRQRGEPELANRMAWWGIRKGLDMGEVLYRELKMSFFGGMYGKETDVPLWPDILRKYPRLKPQWATNEDRKTEIAAVQREISDLVLEVACDFEHTYPGYLVALRHEELVLEGQSVERFTPWLQQRYREATGLPFKMWWDGTISNAQESQPVSRMALLFEG